VEANDEGKKEELHLSKEAVQTFLPSPSNGHTPSSSPALLDPSLTKDSKCLLYLIVSESALGLIVLVISALIIANGSRNA